MIKIIVEISKYFFLFLIFMPTFAVGAAESSSFPMRHVF